MRLIVLALLTLLLAAPHPASGQAASDGAAVLAKAATSVERLRRDPGMARELDPRLARARAVLIVPDLVKGGFILGAEWGTGVLLVKDNSGRWSGPAFYSVASGSVGLQIGIQDAETIFVIMSDAGLKAVMENRFKAGADASVAVAHIGGGAEASTTTNAGADIYAFNKAIGAYGGASLEGSGILPRHSWNAGFYGGNPAPEDIVLARRLDSPQADRLRDVLAR
ncbi:lipid-binding SYLF domain-containing protein [Magnetospirillum moscoviense]|uniref:Ysc84 actin-binding domain-containing protein n=1 Tax=Magnetospirillum moscoviense TaxID=1437059 RepID=A0A178MZ63_9PROT|nr:lipid-binding SYLF domain-containing protein [Magnetospirillum moscoviense]OAN65520.1 hypothetical protein A6A05_06090 [Magnetospirillum moscoviense]